MIAAAEKNLLPQIELVRSVVAMSAAPNPEVLRDNPLGKIPALVLDDATALFDSRVICEYLDGIGSGPRLLPADFDERIECLRWQALGDGLTDILLLWRSEMARGSSRNEVVAAGFDTKVHAAMARLEGEADGLSARDFGLGHIAIVCALGQLDFRFAGCGWRSVHPRLTRWYADMQSRASIVRSVVEDDGDPSAERIAMPLSFTVTAL
jgi:glutathione S-transferase